METLIRVREFIKETFLKKRDSFTLSDDVSLIESGIIDSLGILKVIVFIEKEFGFKAHEQDLIPDNFDNVKAIASFIDLNRQMFKLS
ncbi:MAG TPA: acyl carrier protein [Chitinispirillaceae bacterium]|nr:acyl carrier protein [Chitinispirillaceae bacterium]